MKCTWMAITLLVATTIIVSPLLAQTPVKEKITFAGGQSYDVNFRWWHQASNQSKLFARFDSFVSNEIVRLQGKDEEFVEIRINLLSKVDQEFLNALRIRLEKLNRENIQTPKERWSYCLIGRDDTLASFQKLQVLLAQEWTDLALPKIGIQAGQVRFPPSNRRLLRKRVPFATPLNPEDFGIITELLTARLFLDSRKLPVGFVKDSRVQKVEENGVVNTFFHLHSSQNFLRLHGYCPIKLIPGRNAGKSVFYNNPPNYYWTPSNEANNLFFDEPLKWSLQYDPGYSISTQYTTPPKPNTVTYWHFAHGIEWLKDEKIFSMPKAAIENTPAEVINIIGTLEYAKQMDWLHHTNKGAFPLQVRRANRNVKWKADEGYCDWLNKQLRRISMDLVYVVDKVE